MPEHPTTFSVSTIKTVARDVALALSDQQTYAVVGSAACILLGREASTSDFSIVVPRGGTLDARSLLKAAPPFAVAPLTRHTAHAQTGLAVDILAPPMMFPGAFNAETTVVELDFEERARGTVRVLHPLLLLNATCSMLPRRAAQEQMARDAEDVAFLLEWCVRRRVEVNPAWVPEVTPELAEYTVAQGWIEQELWLEAAAAAGFVLGRGWPSREIH
ncbi:uncharacterized protein BXZ73DRAFT_103796 [Epithele typhae]|uniref:uncharacterized protein n=1 Tax=Epithele typhae TaxID=378194 RepID=UPI002007E4C9|nr:uncharacterized protein BXZ73DRAFT_103796 [Epithele typhae]KAH9923747.1 hypothetical protein BXZ73DRAFT_103796 [Epithele typhae]